MSDILLVSNKRNSALASLYDGVNFDDYDNFYTIIRSTHYQTVEICNIDLFSDDLGVIDTDYTLVWKFDLEDQLNKIYKRKDNQDIVLTPKSLKITNYDFWKVISDIITEVLANYDVDEELTLLNQKTTDGKIIYVIYLNKKAHYHYKIIYGHFFDDDNLFIYCSMIDGADYGVRFTRNSYSGYWICGKDDLLKDDNGNIYQFSDFARAVWVKNVILKLDGGHSYVYDE